MIELDEHIYGQENVLKELLSIEISSNQKELDLVSTAREVANSI